MSGGVRAYGPASLANVAAGFDVLGVALAPLDGTLWGDVVSIAAADADSLSLDGPFAAALPADPALNLTTRAVEAYREVTGARVPPLAVHLTKGLPVGSGLGSSGATIVAMLRAVDALCGGRAGDDALLRAAGRAEAHVAGAAHLDNVAPALLGGLRLIDPFGAPHALPFPGDLCFVLASPALTLATRAARAALPETLPRALAVEHAGNLAALVHALHVEDRALLARTLRDLLAEPARRVLVRGFDAVQGAARGAGALGCTLSGSGPAIFAVAARADAPAVAAAMSAAWTAAGIDCVTRLCAPDPRGARLLEPACA